MAKTAAIIACSPPDQQFITTLRSRHAGLVVKNADVFVEQLRGSKSPAEIALIRKAAEITANAEHAAMQALQPKMNEFEIQALVEYVFRRSGADRPSFASIIGSGPTRRRCTTIWTIASSRRVTSWSWTSERRIKAMPPTSRERFRRRAHTQRRSEQVYQIVRDAQSGRLSARRSSARPPT